VAATSRGFPIVGIGASAGGLEAFRRLLGALPVDSGMAYVLVQHLDPRHESILAELLSEGTPMEVAEVKGDVRVEPNRVYVIPPSKDIVLVDDMLKLVERNATAPRTCHRFLPEDAGRRAGKPGHRRGPLRHGLGRHLGSAGDRGRGRHRLRPGAGLGQVRPMPKSAIAAGGVDFVLTPRRSRAS
jgi:two-component system CheB/CheR fusion protein